MSVSAPTRPTRKQMIDERQRRSAVWRVIHWLGSLQLALILLATIAAACALATFMESGFTSKVAREYIYRAPWFMVWLGVLCVNLFAVTLTRWPWQKKHIGFVVTHYGIITLLIGAIIGMSTGFEGNVTLQKDALPVSRVTTSRSIIQLESPADNGLYIMGFDAETAKLSEKRPRVFPVPDTKLNIVADEFSPNLIREEKLVTSETADAGPGVLLRLSSKMTGQSLEMPLHLAQGQPDQEDFFGLASINLRPTLPPVTAPADRETQIVFAKYAPVIQPGGTPSGVVIRLSEDGEKVTIVSAEGVGATYLRKDLLDQAITEAGALISVEKFWPDFAMENGVPVSKSEDFNNPAILVHVSKQAGASTEKPSLEMAVTGDGVGYQLRRGGQVYATGTAKAGESFNLGWNDWQAEILQAMPNAVVVSETKPGPELPKGGQGIPGFRAHLVSPEGKSGPSRWVESGQVLSLTDGRNVVRVGYGLETKPVPFSLRLVKFEVPRDEGSDAPSNFLATVEFRDAKTGATKTGVAQMNRPASYPGTLLANVTGINYKFSQAEWNPRDLDQTTLQVLYDPGWLLKWVGSLGICIGIAIMFYWKPGGN